MSNLAAVFRLMDTLEFMAKRALAEREAEIARLRSETRAKDYMIGEVSDENERLRARNKQLQDMFDRVDPEMDKLLAEIKRLRALVEAGDELYASLADQEQTNGQREAMKEYALLPDRALKGLKPNVR